MSGTTPSSSLDLQKVPELVVFDLDACCWYPEMYMMRSGSPFATTEDPKTMVSAGGERVRLLGVVAEAWRELHETERFRTTRIAVASRCDVPSWARELLQRFEIADGVTMWAAAEEGRLVEIYKGSKQKHFRALHDKTKIPFHNMLFFDDDPWNVAEVSKLGVTCTLTPDGVTDGAWRLGLMDYAANGGAEAPED